MGHCSYLIGPKLSLRSMKGHIMAKRLRNGSPSLLVPMDLRELTNSPGEGFYDRECQTRLPRELEEEALRSLLEDEPSGDPRR